MFLALFFFRFLLEKINSTHSTNILSFSPSPPPPPPTKKKKKKTGARRTLVYLILTLNAAYPDYDFGGLRARHFRKENGLAAVEDAVDAHLLEVARVWDATPGHGGGSGGAACQRCVP